jgi:5'-3' exonuclease
MNTVVIDFRTLAHRQKHAARGAADNPAMLAYALLRALRSESDKHEADRVIFALEGIPAWRRQLLPEYKAQRPKMETAVADVFWEGVRIFREICQTLPVWFARHPDHEADDIAAAMAAHFTKNDDDKVVIVSTDTDFMQIPGRDEYARVSVWNPVREFFLTPMGIDYVAYKALKGDGSDNIDGFKGIGEKRAAAICESPDTLISWLAEQGAEAIEKFSRNVMLISFASINVDEIKIEKHELDYDEFVVRARAREMPSLIDGPYGAKFEGTMRRMAKSVPTALSCAAAKRCRQPPRTLRGDSFGWGPGLRRPAISRSLALISRCAAILALSRSRASRVRIRLPSLV